tara:strand:- start:1375 stop:1698 length:324 start_codon:yes stop_codon:yes gene_type:complete
LTSNAIVALGSALVIVIEREYGISHGDFGRIFPRIEPKTRQTAERRFQLLHADGRSLQIELAIEQARLIASLKIPFTQITFRFMGWSSSQRIDFFRNFDQSFQKGGG